MKKERQKFRVIGEKMCREIARNGSVSDKTYQEYKKIADKLSDKPPQKH